MLHGDPRLSFPENYRWMPTFGGDGRVAYWTYHPENWTTLTARSGANGPKLNWFTDGSSSMIRKPEGGGILRDLAFRWPEMGGNERQGPAGSNRSETKHSFRCHRQQRTIGHRRSGSYLVHEATPRLYRQRGKLRVAVFKENEPNAFSDGRNLRNVTLDYHGNVFLYTDHREECVLVRPKSPPPRTELESAVKEDAIVAHLQSNSSGKHWFEWRLDPGNGASRKSARRSTLEPLPNGRHTLEARAVDENLQVDPQGARPLFDVAVDYPKRVRTALQILPTLRNG